MDFCDRLLGPVWWETLILSTLFGLAVYFIAGGSIADVDT